MRLRSAVSLCLLVVVMLLAQSNKVVAQTGLPHIRVNGIYPLGAKTDSKVDVSITGTDLDDASELIFSDPGITATQNMSTVDSLNPKSKPVANSFQVSVAKSVKPGRYEFRVLGRFGLSNPRSFMVGSFPEIVASNNNSPDTATEVAINSTVNAKASSSAINFYKFTAAKDQKINVVCLGKSIDSKMNPQITITDEKGKQIVWAKEYNAGDASLHFKAPEAGTYFLLVQDHVYGGGDTYRYRLSIHDKALVKSIYPPVGKAGTSAKFTLYGYNLPGGTAVAGEEQSGLQQKEITIQLPTIDKASSVGFATPKSYTVASHVHQDPALDPLGLGLPIAISTNNVVAETEPNTAEKPQKVSVNQEYVGTFSPRGDRDYVQFDAKAGTTYDIEIISDRQNSGADPFLLIEKGKMDDQKKMVWTKVSEIDDSNKTTYTAQFNAKTSDGHYRFTASEDQAYRIQLRHLYGDSEGGRSFVYRLIIKDQQPDFQIVALPAKPSTGNNNQYTQGYVSIRKGGSVPISLYVERQGGFSEDIEISAANLPTGVTCSPVVISGNSSSASLVLKASADAPKGHQAIQVSAKAKINGTDQVKKARTGDLVWGTTNIQNELPIARLTQSLRVHVIDSETTPAEINLENAKPIETSVGGKLEFPVKLVRRDGFKEEVSLNARGLSSDFKPAAVKIAGDKAEAKYALTLNNTKITPGTYVFYLAGTTKWKYGRNPDAVKVAEEEKKQLDQLYADIKKKEGELNTAKTNIANEIKQVEQQVSAAKKRLQDVKNNKENQSEIDKATKELADAETKLTEQKKSLTTTESEIKAQADLIKKADQKKKEIATSISNLKKLNVVKDYNIDLISPTVVLKVDSSPVNIKAPGELTIEQDAKQNVKVAIDRLYGFDDYSDISFELPKGISGISLAKSRIDKGKADKEFEIKTSSNATVGKHPVTVKATSRWNNVTSTRTSQLWLTVNAKEAEKK